jgi:hypothetical protein
MTTLRYRTIIDERRILELTLPSTIRPGTADVTVMLEYDEGNAAAGATEPPSEAVIEALMRFGDGRRLGGLSIKEMAAEGRR